MVPIRSVSIYGRSYVPSTLDAGVSISAVVAYVTQATGAQCEATFTSPQLIAVPAPGKVVQPRQLTRVFTGRFKGITISSTHDIYSGKEHGQNLGKNSCSNT